MQGLPDWCPANAQAVGQMLFGQSLTRRESSGQDIGFQIVIGPFPHRGGLFRGF